MGEKSFTVRQIHVYIFAEIERGDLELDGLGLSMTLTLTSLGTYLNSLCLIFVL